MRNENENAQQKVEEESGLAWKCVSRRLPTATLALTWPKPAVNCSNSNSNIYVQLSWPFDLMWQA